MSGFEIVGVVFGVLPFFIEAGKAYSDNVTSLRKATSRGLRDKELEEFYREFYWETFQLKKSIEKIVCGLPGLSEDRKQEIIESQDVESWSRATDVEKALKEFFACEGDHQAFEKVMEKVLSLLARLVEDKTVRVSKAERSNIEMYRKLETFQKESSEQKTESSFIERFKFWKKEKDRNVCLRNLNTWNKRITIMVNAACTAAEKRQPTTSRPKGPSSQLRALSRRLFTALQKCWSCDCDGRHEARFCLASCMCSTKDSTKDSSGVKFDFLVTNPRCHSQWKWREGTVRIKASDALSSLSSEDRAELARICDVDPNIQTVKYCLQLLIEDCQISTSNHVRNDAPKLQASILD
ncbi:putative intracellular serine protease protein [Fusarium austroafricanum]|uniref:Putative intracellular serine protease protein n=1 Tax=Fusarium austroafricanum TaxID=2364996 RepID=A0A8H4KYF9_9HYPO|nr:putative intracellular serine protease protein [Fusarium austroafricanum]